jgi:hypothetical protein
MQDQTASARTFSDPHQRAGETPSFAANPTMRGPA